MNKVREIRKKKNLTQLDLAKMTDIYPNDISQIERGKRKAFPGWRKRLAKALEVPEEELFPEIQEVNE